MAGHVRAATRVSHTSAFRQPCHTAVPLHPSRAHSPQRSPSTAGKHSTTRQLRDSPARPAAPAPSIPATPTPTPALVTPPATASAALCLTPTTITNDTDTDNRLPTRHQRGQLRTMSSPRRRIESDVMRLLMSDYEVTLVHDNMSEFYVRFKGPDETPFTGGTWKVHVELPDQYPYKSPSIGFVNRIFHPNIDELSGSVCLDVINQTWSPMFDMINIFEVFLPQLLRYPNPTDPLNGEAAALLMREPKAYEVKVKEYVQKYATKEAVDDGEDDSGEEDEMSSVGSFDSGDDEPAGQMEV